MKMTEKLSKRRPQLVAASYTAGSGIGVGGIALACNIPLPEVAFMVGVVIAAGCVISYVKSIDKTRESE